MLEPKRLPPEKSSDFPDLIAGLGRAVLSPALFAAGAAGAACAMTAGVPFRFAASLGIQLDPFNSRGFNLRLCLGFYRRYRVGCQGIVRVLSTDPPPDDFCSLHGVGGKLAIDIFKEFLGFGDPGGAGLGLVIGLHALHKRGYLVRN
jgi:hypothetical protein